MARDFEDLMNLDHLPDDDIRDLIRERLDLDDAFDADAVDVTVAGGRVRVEGRVGTEAERQHVDHVLESLGAADYENNVVVDPVARAERSEAADIARLEDAAVAEDPAESGGSTSDTAEHLRNDDAGELDGTRDMGKAIEEGLSYNPPDGPIQEGSGEGERH